MTEGVEANPLEARIKAKLAERNARLGNAAQSTTQATAPQPATISVPTEDVPDIGVKYTDPMQEQLDKAIESLGIIEAYNKWCKKMVVKPTSRKDGIKVSCPNPKHPDRNPSAWLNTEKNTYFCGGCAEGGDIWDIAAYHFGFDVPGYKSTEPFKELKIRIAEDLGYQISSGPGWMNIIPPGAGAITPAPSGSITPTTSHSSASPTEPVSSSSTPSEEPVTPKPGATQSTSGATQPNPGDEYEIPWRDFVPEDTFLREWLIATTVDDCAEEFHFWTGLQALGLAAGGQVLLEDVPKVHSNLYICLMGPSGSKKSQAKRHLKETLLEILPYDYDNPFTTGTKIIGGAGSGEYLLSNFSSPIYDPGDPKKILGHAPVRGFVEYEELAQLMAAASRQSSTLRTNLMDIYDAPKLLSSGSRTHGKTTVEHPYGVAFSTTQNSSLAGLLHKGDDGSGFVNRWIFVSGKMKRVTSWGKIQVDLTKAQGKIRETAIWANKGHLVAMSQPALDLWDEFFHATLLPTKRAAEASGTSMLGRLDLTMKKLILLFCINEKLDTVPAYIVERVLALFPYLVSSYGVVGKEISRTAENDLAAKTLMKIKEFQDTTNPLGPTAAELQEIMKHDFKYVKELKELLGDLDKTNMVVAEEIRTGKRGRPPVRYRVDV